MLTAIRAHPMQLVGDTVPNVKNGEGQVLRTAQEAKDWQDAVRHILGTQVNSRTEALLNDARPILSVVQDSISLFRSNKDLVPGTKEYNPELARRFIKIAKPYLYEAEGKALGFRVDVQPLVDSIREDLGTQAPTPTARQEQVAGQARTPEGKFDAPQAGIPSRSGNSGVEEEDFGAFWGTVHMPNMNI